MPWLITFLATLASLIGIAIGIHTGDALWGQRGGAVTVAATFALLFWQTGDPKTTIENLNDASPAGPATTEDKIARLRTAVGLMLAQDRNLRNWMTGNSVFGTLVWGFGDLIVQIFVKTSTCTYTFILA